VCHVDTRESLISPLVLVYDLIGANNRNRSVEIRASTPCDGDVHVVAPILETNNVVASCHN
jgi:hypothetical protein